LIYFKAIMLGRATGRVFFFFFGNFVAIAHKRKSQIWLQVEECNRKNKIDNPLCLATFKNLLSKYGRIQIFFLKMWRISPKNPLYPVSTWNYFYYFCSRSEKFRQKKNPPKKINNKLKCFKKKALARPDESRRRLR
jgi:hypothetical protein